MHENPLVFQKEIYAGIRNFIAGAIYYTLMVYLQSYKGEQMLVTLIVGVTARLLAIKYQMVLTPFFYNEEK